MKENENQEPSSMAGAAKGGNTSKEIVGSAVSAAAGEPVATDGVALADERIGNLWESAIEQFQRHERGVSVHPSIYLTRAIERELIARLAAPTQVSAPQAEVLIREAREVFDLMLDGCNEQEFGDFQNGHGETIGKRMDALHARLRTFPGATRAGAPQAGQEAQAGAAHKGRAVPEPMLVPKWAGEFHSYQNWVNKAQSRLASPGYRPAMCIDAKGRRCAIGSDFMRARDEGSFPVRYFWECEIVPASTSGAPAAPDEVRNALRPFAALAELFDDGKRASNMPSTGTICAWARKSQEYELTVEHLRAARHALRTTTATGAEKGGAA